MRYDVEAENEYEVKRKLFEGIQKNTVIHKVEEVKKMEQSDVTIEQLKNILGMK